MAYRNLYAGPDHAQSNCSAVSSVLYAVHGQHGLQETRHGSCKYDGSPSLYHEWVFRVSLKVYKGYDKEKYAESMSKIMDGLTGIVFVVAQEIGLDALMYPGHRDRSADDDETVDDGGSTEGPPTADGRRWFGRTAAPTGSADRSTADASATAPTPDAAQALRVTRPSGLDVLIEAVKRTVFPQTSHEAKELFRQYCKSNGSLARQKSESMHQYVNRRKRCGSF